MAGTALSPTPLRAETASLKAKAARRGLYFGSAVLRAELERDPSYADAVIRDCSVLVPAWETKWAAIEPRRGKRDYSDAEWILRFCNSNGLGLRGHPAIWAASLPDWVERALRVEPAMSLIRDHVTALLRHFQGRVVSWDVVNEAIEPLNGRADGLRTSQWLNALGPGYIDEAFRVAREVNPRAELVYNEAELDYADLQGPARRAAVLRLLEHFRRSRVPCDALGIQAHLWAADRRFEPSPLRQFLAEVASMGYKIIVTELDVNDRDVSGSIEVRDQAVSDMARRYLDVVLDEASVRGVLTWGMSDRYTWLNQAEKFPDYARQDGVPSRPLPLDSGLRPKALWHALAAAFDAAPNRNRI